MPLSFGNVNLLEADGLLFERNTPAIALETATETELSAFSSGEVRTGATRASGVCVTVQRGTSAIVNFSIAVQTISISSFNEFRQSLNGFIASEQLSEIERFSNHSSAGFYFASLFGLVFHRDRSFYFQRSNRNAQFAAFSQEQSRMTESVFNLRTETVRASGQLRAVGTSNIPATVCAYVQTTQFMFANNQKLNVFNLTDRPGLAPLALDDEGNQAATSEDQEIQLLS